MKKSVLIFTIALLSAFSLAAQDIPDKPSPPRLVNDFANVLSASEIAQLENELDEFARSTSTQIAVVTVPSLNGYDIADYAFRLGEKWGIGQKGSDNGVVVLYKPKTDNEKGQVFVAVGYGLEGVIPDAVANRLIVNNEMIPHFRENDTYGGLSAGCKVIMSLASKEFTAKEYEEENNDYAAEGFVIFVLGMFIFFIIISILASRNRDYTIQSGQSGQDSQQANANSSLPWWVLLSMLNSGNSSGKWDDFNSGGGSFGGGFGGGSSGGFGGFGGGSFGGGGAGGSW
ncbi:MAG: TPM domain-containing protein [Dysgonamonadaceae bacterium]|nr:TPM domain-containing protein [Dysgonamonadaceae bacterium]